MDKYLIAKRSVTAHQHTDLYYHRENEFRFTHQLVDYRVTYCPDSDMFKLEKKSAVDDAGWSDLLHTSVTVNLLAYIYSL